MKLPNLPKREPVLVAAVVLALINLFLGKDSGLSVDAIQAVLPLLLGVVVRTKVSPTAKEPAAAGD